jgi:hypothetical protein
MSRDVKPYLGRTGTGISAPTLWKADNGTDDAGTDFQATLKTKDFIVAPDAYSSMQHDALLLAKVASGVTITLTTDRDFGAETSTSSAVLTAAASETRKEVKFEGAQVGEARAVNWTLGDSAAADNAWVLDRLTVPLTMDDRK